MANEIEIINGVSKKERNGIYVYDFPLVRIEAYPVLLGDFMYIISKDRGQNHKVDYAAITEPFGSSNIVEYCDALAAGGYYFTNTGSGSPIDLSILEASNAAIETATESIDAKTPADPATVTKQDEIIAAIGAIPGAGNSLDYAILMALNNINEQLREMNFLLKNIAE